MNKTQLKHTAKQMVAKGKGILAADESTPTIEKRFDIINVISTETTRRDWRTLLLTTKEAMANHISGIILYDETIRQTLENGTALVSLIKETNTLIGIKVDEGAKPFPNHEGEKLTKGLDGLDERLKDYHKLGANFAKWRAVINIDETNHLPSDSCLDENCQALARYARLCQEANIVPILEPEIIMDGPHSQDTCAHITKQTLTKLYEACKTFDIYLEGTILKPNMIVSGTDHPNQANIEQVAHATLECFSQSVPENIGGIVFLSGGQSDIEATAHLNAMNKIKNKIENEGDKNHPYSKIKYPLSFSYGRALQAAPLKAWAGKQNNIKTAQNIFLHRAKMNALATLGKWDESLEAPRSRKKPQ